MPHVPAAATAAVSAGGINCRQARGAFHGAGRWRQGKGSAGELTWPAPRAPGATPPPRNAAECRLGPEAIAAASAPPPPPVVGNDSAYRWRWLSGRRQRVSRIGEVRTSLPWPVPCLGAGAVLSSGRCPLPYHARDFRRSRCRRTAASERLQGHCRTCGPGRTNP